MAESANPQVLMETSFGPIRLQLFPEQAPKTVANFMSYINEGFYDGTIFHRVIPNFMIQGGGFTPEMKEKPTHAPIPNEADNGLKHKRGTLAMARTSDPHSASAQFFINLTDNEFLEHKSKTARGWGYAVFGEVVEGMQVVDAIVATPTTHHGHHQDVPKETVLIETVRVVE